MRNNLFDLMKKEQAEQDWQRDIADYDRYKTYLSRAVSENFKDMIRKRMQDIREVYKNSPQALKSLK